MRVSLFGRRCENNAKKAPKAPPEATQNGANWRQSRAGATFVFWALGRFLTFSRPAPRGGVRRLPGGLFGLPRGRPRIFWGGPGSRKRSRNKPETPSGARGAPDALPGVDLDPLWAPCWVDLGVKFASISGYFCIDSGQTFGKPMCHTPRHAFVLTQRLRETTDSYWGDR